MARTAGKLDGDDKRLLLMAAVVMLVLGGLFGWWAYLDAPPVVHLPTPAMPVPNARDAYLKAVALLRDTPNIDNAVSAFAGGSRPMPPAAALAAELKASAPALAALRAGYTQTYRETPLNWYDEPTPWVARYRQCARILVVDSHLRARRGDWAGARDDVLDAQELAVSIVRGGPLLSMLVGTACEAFARRQAWAVLPRLPAPQAQAMLTRLRRIEVKRTPLADTLEEEKWCLLRGLVIRMRQRGWQRQLYADSMPDPRAYLVSKRAAVRHFAAYMDMLIARARQPFDAHRPPPPPPPDPITLALISNYTSELYFRATLTEAYAKLLLTATALRCYRLEHGAYPASLAALAPAYLPVVPADPFTRHAPFRYARTAAGSVLYSVGPDGKDDAGTPSRDGYFPTVKKPHRPCLLSDSTGDIVAGINLN
jgi:hypothetical protein